MEYELFLYSIYDVKYIAKLIAGITKEVIKREINVTEDDGDIHFACGIFAMDIELEEYEDINFINEHYNTNVNTRICIQVFNKSFEAGIAEVMQIIVCVLKQSDGDVLLLFNGSEQILRRDQKELIFNEVTPYIPYDQIDIPFKKAKLKTM